MGYVAGHHSPAADVQEYYEFDEIQGGKTGREKHPHPNHPLIVDQVKDIFCYFEVAVLGKGFFEIPAPAGIQDTDEDGTNEVKDEDEDHCDNLLKKYLN